MSVRELAGIVSEVTGKPLNINWGGRPYREREFMDTPLSAYQVLPLWKPKVSLRKGVQSLVNV